MQYDRGCGWLLGNVIPGAASNNHLLALRIVRKEVCMVGLIAVSFFIPVLI